MFLSRYNLWRKALAVTLKIIEYFLTNINFLYLGVCVGTSDILKSTLFSNQYYNRKKIYRKFIHVKDMPCHVYSMTSGLSGLEENMGNCDNCLWQSILSNHEVNASKYC